MIPLSLDPSHRLTRRLSILGGLLCGLVLWASGPGTTTLFASAATDHATLQAADTHVPASDHFLWFYGTGVDEENTLDHVDALHASRARTHVGDVLQKTTPPARNAALLPIPGGVPIYCLFEVYRL